MKQLFILLLTIGVLNAEAQTSSVALSEQEDLQAQIGASVIVGLGESGHGFESINKTKSDFIHFLQSDQQFGAIAFESSFTESIISYFQNDLPDSRTRAFLYPFWNTPSVKAALKGFMDGEKSFAKPLVLGFDIQEDCRFEKLSQFLGSKGLITTRRKELAACDSILSLYIGKDYSRKGAITGQEYLTLATHLELVQAELKMKPIDAFEKKLLERCLENRKWLCQYLKMATASGKMYFRDSLMAANIVWLQKEVYGDTKFIVWAANTHISKLANGHHPRWTGEWLSSIFGDQYLAIAFEKGTAENTFVWESASFPYTLNPNRKFDAAVYTGALKKIKAQEWITPCE